MDFTARNAKWLSPEGWSTGALSVVGGFLARDAGRRVVDLKGFELRPGIIDVHGDGFERHLAPRRGVVKDLGAGLEALDAELAANGITTAWLAQFWSWEGGMRAPDFARALVTALQETKPRLHVDMRVQLRVETMMVHQFDEIADFVERARIGYVVFNDHVPHAALAAGKTPPRLTGQALKGGRSPEAHLAFLRALHGRRNDVPAALGRLAARLRAMG
ncbi:MAG: alpha-D-ribose 1-methylphosphonate 5-triphosphate diphosphatase, partial [Pseudomonadota bacterium]